jgi:hypothetical protein
MATPPKGLDHRGLRGVSPGFYLIRGFAGSVLARAGRTKERN